MRCLPIMAMLALSAPAFGQTVTITAKYLDYDNLTIGDKGFLADPKTKVPFTAVVKKIISETKYAVGPKGSAKRIVIQGSSKGLANDKEVSLSGLWEVIGTEKIASKTHYVVKKIADQNAIVRPSPKMASKSPPPPSYYELSPSELNSLALTGHYSRDDVLKKYDGKRIRLTGILDISDDGIGGTVRVGEKSFSMAVEFDGSDRSQAFLSDASLFEKLRYITPIYGVLKKGEESRLQFSNASLFPTNN